MSQIVTRKGPVGEDKEKGQSNDTPVKEMKKKMAANAEKEKQAAEKHAEKDKEKDKEKSAETKQTEKPEKNVEKNSEKKEKSEKNAEKNSEKKEKSEKASEKKEKSDKASEKKEKSEKASEKKEKQAEKEKLDKSVDKTADKKTEAPVEKPKEDKHAKQEKPKEEEKEKDKDTEKKEKDRRRSETPKPKMNGARANGDHGDHGEDSDGTVSSDEELVIIDHERDDMFPELAYDDSDGEFEPPTPEGLPSRSYTRRSQAKSTRTPETPRPASERLFDRDLLLDDSKEFKVLRMKEDTPVTDRKLRSSDSPKPETKKDKRGGEKEKETGKEVDATRTGDKPTPKKKDLELPEPKDDDSRDEPTVEGAVDMDMDEGAGGARGAGVKDGTNYSRSRVKVSPYRRLADQTTSSVTANYTGNNTTMEMDITESSLSEEAAPAASPYLSGLRAIRGRRSYKPLKEMALRNISVNRSTRSTTSITVTEQPSRPTAPVVGRKRKPEGDESVELASEAHEVVRGKRARLLEKLARPFRGAASTPLPVRRNAEIVGINTDLPLTAPVASPETFDPETLKTSPAVGPAAPPAPAPAPAPGLRDRDNKRCSVM